MKKLKTVLPHLISWGVVLFIGIVSNINFIEFDVEQRKVFFYDNAPIWATYVFFFYTCYLLLIPKLLFKKRYIWFGIAMIVVYFGSFMVLKYQTSTIYASLLRNKIETVSSDKDISKDRCERIIRKIESRLETVERERYSINIFSRRGIQLAYTLFFVLMVVLSISMLSKWQEHKRVEKELRQRQMESELSYLKQQINPHFLFNALNSIYSLVISNSNDAGDAVLKLSAILRYMLYDTDKPAVSLRNEIDMILDYLALQKLKSTGVTKVSFVSCGDVEHKNIPPLVLIPFIENAFKHGSDNVHESFIDISIDVKDNQLLFDIKNNVVCTQKNSSDGGIGIANIKRRLEIMYPDNYLLTTKQQDNIYCVSLRIPILS